MQRLITLLTVFIIYTNNAIGQLSPNQQAGNLSNLCKTWGFLKYYHPEVAKGKINWDSVLVSLIPQVTNANKEKLNIIYKNLLNNLGEVAVYKADKNNGAGWSKKNLNLNWLGDGRYFTGETVLKLNHIREYRNRDSNYYVSGSPYFETKGMANAFFQNEKPYKEMRFPNQEYRLLSLFRFWNIINYYYPYKYSLKEDWEYFLERIIPVFVNSKDTLQYDKALQQLVYSIYDSHADFTTRKLEAEYGDYRAPFSCKIIEGKAVVTGILSDSICRLIGVEIGDIISVWNGELIKDRIKKLSAVIPASNEWARLRDICFGRLLASKEQTATVVLVKTEFSKDVAINCISKREAIMKQLAAKDFMPAFKKVSDSIGYINFGKPLESAADSIMQSFKNMKAIIFDLRQYPKDGAWFSITQNYIYPNKRNFALVVQPEYSNPGIFKILANGIYKTIDGEDQPCGIAGKENNTDYYKGKVIVLVNEGTQSQGETAAMVFKAGPNTVIIGSPTAGANGDISEITFVGGMKANMSGLGFYLPDGSEVQRVGISPDILIRPTISGIRKGKDEILDGAVKHVNTQLKRQ